MIPKRNIALVYVFGLVSFGLYFLYWFYKTRCEMNSLGAKIPTTILLLIPLVNFYWLYKYSEAFATVLKKDGNTVLYFVINLFAGFVTPYLVQTELNKHAK